MEAVKHELGDTEQQQLREKLLELLTAGAPFAEAVKIVLADRDRALGAEETSTQGAISRLASRRGLNRANTSSALHGGRALSWEMAVRLSEDLGGTPAWWRELHTTYARPVRVRATA